MKKEDKDNSKKFIVRFTRIDALSYISSAKYIEEIDKVCKQIMSEDKLIAVERLNEKKNE